MLKARNYILEVPLQVHPDLKDRHALSKFELADLSHANSAKFSACLVGQLSRKSIAVVLDRSSHPFCGFCCPTARECSNRR